MAAGFSIVTTGSYGGHATGGYGSEVSDASICAPTSAGALLHCALSRHRSLRNWVGVCSRS